uniref:Uncharacterized protein n=1 Tax=viral metagenome TaxID=1070528 RepID=A0A6C0E6R4_9ZZZZ
MGNNQFNNKYQERFMNLPNANYYVSSKDIEYNINPSPICDSVLDAIALLTNPKESSLNNTDKVHCHFTTTLDKFNNIYYKCNAADLISHIKLVSPVKLNPKLIINQLNKKTLLSTFKETLSDNNYKYECIYFNNPMGCDVILNMLILHNFIEIDIDDVISVENIKVEYIGTFLNTIKRRAIYMSNHTFMYPDKIISYHDGIVDVKNRENHVHLDEYVIID